MSEEISAKPVLVQGHGEITKHSTHRRFLPGHLTQIAMQEF
jgi:hypothetical protein